MRTNVPATEIDDALTGAEAAVFRLLCTGRSNKEIAAELGKADSTVKNQIASIYRKRRVASRAQLLAGLLGNFDDESCRMPIAGSEPMRTPVRIRPDR